MNRTIHRAGYDLGTLVKVYAALPILSTGVALCWREFYAAPAFLVTAGVAYGLGRALEAAFGDPPDVDLAAGVLTASVGWFLAGVASGLPLLLVARTVALEPTAVATPPPSATLETFARPLDAVFEGMSGVTGTGFSMASDPGELPRSLQWWRSVCQWVGGIGVIVLAAAFASSDENASFAALHGNQAPTESIRSTTTGTAAAIWWLLALFTVSGALLLWLAGMGPWAALNHAMTGVTTGGFTITADSIAAYDDPLIELAAVALMVVGAVSFTVSFFLFRGDYSRIRGDAQTVWLFAAVVLGTVVVVPTLLHTGAYATGWTSLRYGVFQFVSGLTCTGFQTDTSLGSTWAGPEHLLVTGAMIVGGAAGSTAGGIKVIRLRRVLLESPSRGTEVYESEGRSPDVAGRTTVEFDTAAIIALLWFVLLGVTTFVALLTVPTGEYTTANVLFEVASVQGNVGLSAGIVDPGMPRALKATFVATMWIGRLEIVPVIVSLKTLLEVAGRW